MLCNLLESKMKYQFNVQSVISYQSGIDAFNNFGIDLSTLFYSVNKAIKIRTEYICFMWQKVIQVKECD